MADDSDIGISIFKNPKKLQYIELGKLENLIRGKPEYIAAALRAKHKEVVELAIPLFMELSGDKVDKDLAAAAVDVYMRVLGGEKLKTSRGELDAHLMALCPATRTRLVEAELESNARLILGTDHFLELEENERSERLYLLLVRNFRYYFDKDNGAKALDSIRKSDMPVARKQEIAIAAIKGLDFDVFVSGLEMFLDAPENERNWAPGLDAIVKSLLDIKEFSIAGTYSRDTIELLEKKCRPGTLSWIATSLMEKGNDNQRIAGAMIYLDLPEDTKAGREERRCEKILADWMNSKTFSTEAIPGQILNRPSRLPPEAKYRLVKSVLEGIKTRQTEVWKENWNRTGLMIISYLEDAKRLAMAVRILASLPDTTISRTMWEEVKHQIDVREKDGSKFSGWSPHYGAACETNSKTRELVHAHKNHLESEAINAKKKAEIARISSGNGLFKALGEMEKKNYASEIYALVEKYGDLSELAFSRAEFPITEKLVADICRLHKHAQGNRLSDPELIKYLEKMIPEDSKNKDQIIGIFESMKEGTFGFEENFKVFFIMGSIKDIAKFAEHIFEGTDKPEYQKMALFFLECIGWYGKYGASAQDIVRAAKAIEDEPAESGIVGRFASALGAILLAKSRQEIEIIEPILINSKNQRLVGIASNLFTNGTGEKRVLAAQGAKPNEILPGKPQIAAKVQ